MDKLVFGGDADSDLGGEIAELSYTLLLLFDKFSVGEKKCLEPLLLLILQGTSAEEGGKAFGVVLGDLVKGEAILVGGLV